MDLREHAVVRFDAYALDFIPHLLASEGTSSIGFAVQNRTAAIPVPERPPCPTAVELEVFPERPDAGLPEATGTFERGSCSSLSTLPRGPRCSTTPSPSGCSGVRATAFDEALDGASAFRFSRDIDALTFSDAKYPGCTNHDRFFVRTCHFTPPWSPGGGCSRDRLAVSCRTEAYARAHGTDGASVRHSERVVPDSFRATLVADGGVQGILHVSLQTRTLRDSRPAVVSVQVKGTAGRIEAATLFLGSGRHRATIPIPLDSRRWEGYVRMAVQVRDDEGTPLHAETLGFARQDGGVAPPRIRYGDTVQDVMQTTGERPTLAGTCLYASTGPGNAIDLASPVICSQNGTVCSEGAYHTLLRDGDATGSPSGDRLRCAYRCSCVAACLDDGHLHNGSYAWLHGLRVSAMGGGASDRAACPAPTTAPVRSYLRGTIFVVLERPGEPAAEGRPPRSAADADLPLTLAIVALLLSLVGAASVASLRCRIAERRRARTGSGTTARYKKGGGRGI